MPHGGYHGVLKMGGKIIQQGSPAGAPVGQGGQYNPDGYATEMAGSSGSTQSDLQIVQNQAKKIKDIEKKFKGIDDPRSKFLALQTPKQLLTNAQKRRIQNRRRIQMMEDFKAGKNIDKSEFTGRKPKEGTKSSILNAFGIGTVPTGKPKLREGLSSAEYATYMSDLYKANPGMMESLFPGGSGKFIRNVSKLFPGIGTIQNIASAAKQKTGNILNKMFPGLIPDSGIATTQAAKPTLAELNENAFRFGSFNVPTNIKDIKAENERRDAFTDFRKADARLMFSAFPNQPEGFYGISGDYKDPKNPDNPLRIVSVPSLFTPSDERPEDFFEYQPLQREIIEGSKLENLPNIDVSMEGIAPILNSSNLSSDPTVDQAKNYFRQAITGEPVGVPFNIGQIYDNLLQSGNLTSSEALQFGNYVRSLPPPSQTYGGIGQLQPIGTTSQPGLL